MTNDPHAHTSLLHAGAPLGEAALAVVALHGRGGSARDLLSLSEVFDLDRIAWLAPQASNGTWYPLSFLAPRAANEPYLSSALARVAATVRSCERAGLTKEQVVILGFSQGACLATEFVARHPARYGGLVAFTGGLIGAAGEELQANGENQAPVLGNMPALLTSGDPDSHVPWARVQESADTLRALGANVTERRYPGRPHLITPEEYDRARALLLAARDVQLIKQCIKG